MNPFLAKLLAETSLENFASEGLELAKIKIELPLEYGPDQDSMTVDAVSIIDRTHEDDTTKVVPGDARTETRLLAETGRSLGDGLQRDAQHGGHS